MNFFVGLWPIISHFGTGLIITVACVAVALLATELGAIPIIGPLLASLARPIRMWAIVAAVGSVVGLVGYSMGVKNESDRCKAQFVAAQKASIDRSKSAHTGAVRDVSRGVRDPRDTDR
jgi:hypothetical protein